MKSRDSKNCKDESSDNCRKLAVTWRGSSFKTQAAVSGDRKSSPLQKKSTAKHWRHQLVMLFYR